MDNDNSSSEPTHIPGYYPFYETDYGAAYLGDSLQMLRKMGSDSVQLVMTSPPYALQKKKKYGNKDSNEYVDWFMPFAEQFKRVLKDDGSIVIVIGGSWVKGKPVKNLYQYELLLRMCKDLKLHLAQEIYWFNRAKLPSPAQWVTINRWRLKDAADQIFWLSKTPYPKANNERVLHEYSESMNTLLKDRYYYKPSAKRPSGHKMSDKFFQGSGGAIPPNVLEFSNTESNGRYSSLCRKYGLELHPARYPIQLPEFFVNFLTDPDDLVLDPFAGSNATGEAAQIWDRKWVSLEINENYLKGSMTRFFDEQKLEREHGFTTNSK